MRNVSSLGRLYFIKIFVFSLAFLFLSGFDSPVSGQIINPGDGLTRCAAKFQKTKTGRVVFMGGNFCVDAPWVQAVFDNIQKRFPDTKFEFVNASLPSNTTDFVCFRMERHAFTNQSVNEPFFSPKQWDQKPVDLLIFDSWLDEKYSNPYNSLGMGRQMPIDSLFRMAKEKNPEIDIVELFLVDQPLNLWKYTYTDGNFLLKPHRLAGLDYGAAQVDYPGGFTGKGRTPFSSKLKIEDFNDIYAHPEIFQSYSDGMTLLFDQTWGTAIPAAAIAPQAPKELPPEVNRFGYKNRNWVSVADLPVPDGWKRIDSWEVPEGKTAHPSLKGATVWETTELNKELAIPFKGMAIGVIGISGPDSGIMEFQIDKEKDIQSSWMTIDQGIIDIGRKTDYTPWAFMLTKENSNRPHNTVVRLATPPAQETDKAAEKATDKTETGQNEQNSPAQEKKVLRIIGFFINGEFTK